jgi:glycosyltransferase involved in cell wall biosynthesis
MKQNKKLKVIGIILAYKHAKYLPGLYQKLKKIKVLDQIIITNDESGDGIEKVAKKLGILCFSHSRLGYGGNMKYGMRKAMELGATYMVEIHGDGQFDTDFITPAVNKIQKGYDLMLGTRFTDFWQPLRDKMPLIKFLANIGLTFLESLVLGVWVSEFQTGARVYSKKAIRGVDTAHTSDGFPFGFEIIALIAYKKFKIGEVPARAYYVQEHSSISLKNSVIYSFKTFGVLIQFILARMGFKNQLFH